MQVTHQNEHVTHAVIGGKATIDFGISSSAEFFNILSSTLYKDQILAVVREVLCNSWDAHIEAGCTDKPVQITLTNDMFTIKDFGTGIHHDDMGTIYGTYGNSTKKNDGNQTGGFGLGCKAPFAYTDHFEVISCHAGVKTIYNLSKSSAQAQGKPGIIPIASFAAEESGLQVAIRIKSSNDHVRFSNLIQRIVRNGDMNMTINGVALKKLGFDTSKGNYLLSNAGNLLDASTPIMVRYGNVIYPIDPVEKLVGKYSLISKHLGKLGDYPRYQIIFQAPAHSISVTPSRESLSMQDHTVNTLNTLFDGFLKMLDTDFSKECDRYAIETTQKAVTELRLNDLLSRKCCLPSKVELAQVGNIDDLWVMAKRYMSINYPSPIAFRKQDIKRRLELLAKNNLLDRGKVATYLRDLERVQKDYREHSYLFEGNNWLQRRILAPLVTELAKANLDPDKLFVCDSDDINVTSRYSRNSSVLPLVKATNAKPRHLFATLPYLRNIVVLSSAKAGMLERAYRHETFKKLGATQGFLFYHVGLRVADKAAALTFFNNTGMRVVDLTVRQDWEPPVVKATPVPRKPKKKGYVALSNLIQDNTRINTQNFYKEDATRIENPEFVIKLSLKQYDSNYSFEGLDSEICLITAKLFGDKGVVVATTATNDACIDKGAKTFQKYIVEKVCEYMNTNPRIQQYYSFLPSRVAQKISEPDNVGSLINLIYTTPCLMKEFSIINPLTPEDKEYIAIWKQLKRRRYFYTNSPEMDATTLHLENIPLDPINNVLIKKLDKNILVGLMDTQSIREIIQDENTSSPTFKKVVSFLINTLNG